MIINRLNFLANLEKITQIIKQCQFISLDLEMSGLNKGESFRNSQIDSLQQKYWKLKENVRAFLPLQLGLCGFIFRMDGSNIQKIEAFPMSFYLYPYSLHDSLDKIFKFEKDALEFLLAHKFDFNKLFYEGVYFVSREAEKNLQMSKGHLMLKKNLEKNSRVITPDMLAFRAMHEEKIKAFVENYACIGQTLAISVKYMKAKNYKYLENYALEKFPELLEITYDSDSMKDRTKMMIKRIDLNQPSAEVNQKETKLNQKKNEMNLQEGNNISGVRAIFDLITQEKIPLILHNGIYDILQIYDKMIQTPPELYPSFCKEINKNFESIYDTKFILTSSSLLYGQLLNQKSDLTSAYSSLHARYSKADPIIEINKNELSEEFELKSHDAMSDAFMTGFVFLKSLAMLNILKDYQHKQLFDNRTGFFKNKIFNHGAKVPFIIEKPNPEEAPIKRIFSVMDHKLEKIDKKNLENHLKGKYGAMSLFENDLGFYFFFPNLQEENKFSEVIQKEKGLLVEKFGNINLLITEKKISEEISYICLKDDEEVLSKETLPLPETKKNIA